MQQSRFLILTGHLDEYPLSDLIGILRHQQKTGRLLIEYPKSPGIFYFREGKLVDARLGSLSGLQAICVAIAQPGAAFNFNPLIQPSRQSIDNWSQRVVAEMFGCWDESVMEIEASAPLPAPVPDVVAVPETSGAVTPKALLPGRSASNRQRRTVLMAGAGALTLGLSTVIAVTAVTGGFTRRGPASAPTLSKPAEQSPAAHVDPRELTLAPAPVEPKIDPRPERRTLQSKERRSFEQLNDAESRNSQKVKMATAKGTVSKTAPAQVKHVANDTKRSDEEVTNSQAVKVVMQIESGRVSQASIANHRPGMEAYEALALRIARQRRYPAGAAGQETVLIRVNQPK